MALIRIDPTKLHQASERIAALGIDIRRLGDELTGSLESAPGYDGQFGPRIKLMGLEVQVRAKMNALRMEIHSGSLSRRAAAFEAMDQAGVGRFLPDFSGLFNNPDYLRWLAVVTGLPLPLILLLIRLGRLDRLFPNLPWSLIPRYVPYLPVLPGQPGTTDPSQRPVIPTTPVTPPVPVAPVKEEKKTPAPVEPIGQEQDDPRWKDEVMGTNGRTIGNAGCLITCIAMMARSLGANVTPSDVNKYLQQKGGYEPGSSDLYWGVAEQYLESVTGNAMSYQKVASANVASMINSGNPVIIHVKGNTDDGHWVVATGIDEKGNYIVYESGTGEQSTYPPDKLLDGHMVFKIDNPTG